MKIPEDTSQETRVPGGDCSRGSLRPRQGRGGRVQVPEHPVREQQGAGEEVRGQHPQRGESLV